MSPTTVERAAEILLATRRGAERLLDLPTELQPANWQDAYAIQDTVTRSLGDVAGWKVGAGSPTTVPHRAALCCNSISVGPSSLAASSFLFIGIEAEIAFRFAKDLPPRKLPYTRAEVTAAIGTAHAAIEIADTRFANWGSAGRLSQVADQMNHGALVVGSATPEWQGLSLLDQPVTLTIDGRVIASARGGNNAGDPIHLLEWLANGGAESMGGLKAGDIVTTGSCTGIEFVSAGCQVVADFPGLGTAEVKIE